MPTLADLTSRGLLYGGDYNPEQWDRATWREDVAAMRAARVTMVTVGVFSWSMLEPERDRFEPDRMDEVLDMLHAGGIAVDLATPTASPPPWLAHEDPQTLPVDESGHRLHHGSRTHYCPTSPTYRDRARLITRRIVERWADHPAVVMWHVNNELGTTCWCPRCGEAFRTWLRRRYGTLERLAESWGTAVWSQSYTRWEQISPPLRAPYLLHPAHTLDYRRFVSDALLELFQAEREEIRAVDTSRPVTTNFMGFFPGVDYRSWAGDVDVISDDSYPDPADPEAPTAAALTHDLMRGLAGGPWLLMEQATSAVSWRGHNVPKTTARMRQDALRAVAHGSDGVLSFQWRASPTGPERFHSAMVPHAGTDTRVHRAVRQLGADLVSLAAVAGTDVRADVAIVFDWSSWWAAEEPATPTDRLRVLPQLRAWYRPLWEAGIGVDVVAPTSDLARYRLVLAPQLYLLDDDDAANLRDYLAADGWLALGPFSAVADGHARVRIGGFPVPFADLLGAAGEEWWPLPEGPVGLVESGEVPGVLGRGRASVWAERLRMTAAVCDLRFEGGDLDGEPALVHSRDERLHYLATVPDAGLLRRWVRHLAARRGIVPAHPLAHLPAGLEVAQRGPFTFLLNHGDAALEAPLQSACVDVLTGSTYQADVTVPRGGTLVLRKAPQ